MIGKCHAAVSYVETYKTIWENSGNKLGENIFYLRPEGLVEINPMNYRARSMYKWPEI